MGTQAIASGSYMPSPPLGIYMPLILWKIGRTHLCYFSGSHEYYFLSVS